MGFSLIHKEHKNSRTAATTPTGVGAASAASLQYQMVLVGKVKGKTCVLIDDMADSKSCYII